MTDTIQIPYSKNFSYLSLIVIIGMASMFFPFTIKDIQTNDIHDLIFVAFFDIIILLMGLIFIINFFVPSIKGLPALELNKGAIIDNVRHRKIYWNNISAIRTVSSGSSLGIAIDIMDKSKIQEKKNLFNKFQSFLAQLFFGTPVVIADKFIQGSDKEIFAQILMYFEQNKNCT